MIVWNIIWWSLIIIGAIYGTVCMALSLILRNGGRSAIERRLSARGRDQAWRDMDAHRHQTAHVFALTDPRSDENPVVAESARACSHYPR